MRRIHKGRVDDLVLLETLDEDSLLDTLNKRFDNGEIYTYVGNEVLVVVNPFKAVAGLHGLAKMQEYEGKVPFEMPPHVYAVAESVFRAMRREGNSQCVLVSGESGAGKTQAARNVLEYIAATSCGDAVAQNGVKDALLQSNPVLESFGNAKTIRNDNSSRFGKYMEVFFNAAGIPVAGRMSNYLLESPRVVHLNKGEQNYHVFYILLEGLRGEARAKCLLGPGTDATSFAYLGRRARDSDSGVTFAQLQDAMRAIGLPEAAQDDLFRTCASVLWIGNIAMEADDEVGANSGRTGSRISKAKESQEALRNTATLLGLETARLEEALVRRHIITGGEAMERVLSKQEAETTRDALAKALYTRLFNRLVASINEAVRPEQDADSAASIGVLDIYGFEVLEVNSFEQLCINYCNEKLQQLFIELTLRAEQEEYAAEGVPWEHISYFNNKTVCDLLELKQRSKPGLMALLDEECSLLGKVNDRTLIKKLDRTLRSHEHYAEVKTSPDHFTIRHYAGDVRYTADGFLEKNRDSLLRDLVELVGAAANPFVRALFPEASADRDQKKPPTTGAQIKTQMNNLINELHRCSPSYVRCIKSNDSKAPSHFDLERCREQVRFLGLLENVKVRRAGFSHRQPSDAFVARYKMLAPTTWPFPEGTAKEAVRAIMDSINCDEGGYTFGHTKVFVRRPITLFALEEARDAAVHRLATSIQVCYRRYRAQKELKQVREKAASLFGDAKRRGTSFRMFFCGDYVHAAEDPIVCQAAAASERILFADTVTKVSRGCKPQTRLLVLTDAAVLLFRVKGGAAGAAAPARRARIPLAQVTRLTLSTFADGFICLQVNAGRSAAVLLHTPRKAEVVTRLKDVRPDLDVEFRDRFDFAAAQRKRFFGLGPAPARLETRALAFQESESEPRKALPRMRFEVEASSARPTLQVVLCPALGSRAPIQPGKASTAASA